ncbi:MAG: hypothetical protein M3119_06310 [Verrucomicrobiota bacterium]|nr:hypothetical protein [Verrucomicrobiota bacterium]MDQ6939755.1 hypothetical protein [Verrucomicrobiota bacterium]
MNDAALISQCDRWQMRALILGLLAAIISGIGAFVSPVQFFHSYLFAWLFWSGLAIGSLIIVMMQVLSGGVWGAAVRNLSIAAFMTLPLMALLFLPIIFGAHEIYPWSNGANGEAPGFNHKAQWFNVSFFSARSIAYFAIFIVIALLVRRWVIADEMRCAPGSTETSTGLSAISAVGLILYGFLTIFTSTDWVMSLDPKWFSTIFVIIFAAGQFLSALALMTALLAAFARNHSLGETIPTKAFHDLGGMLMAFVIFWTYVSFSQFLIIWSGNLPKEISWYLERSHGGWQWLAVVLVALEFFLPFFLLLSRARKSNPNRLAGICLLVLVASVLNNFWLTAPSFHPGGFYLHWLDLTEWLALGGVWFAMFFYFLKQRPRLAAELLEARQNG